MTKQLLPKVCIERFRGDLPSGLVRNDIAFECSVAYLRFLSEHDNSDIFVAFDHDAGLFLPVRVRRVRCFRLGQVLARVVGTGDPDTEQRFLEGLISTLRRERICDRLILPPTWCVFRAVPRGSRWCPFGSYILTLSGRSEDELFSQMHRDHRHKIRAAIRRGAEVCFGKEQFDVFFQLHSNTMAKSGIHHDTKEYLRHKYECLEKAGQVVCAAVYGGDAPMGALMVPYTSHSGSYLYGGSAEHVSPSGAIKLLHWEVMRWLRERGVGQYDFVGARLSDVSGSKLEYLQRFKSRFGGRLERGFLWKADVRPLRSSLFDFAVNVNRTIKRQSRGSGDLIEQELRKTPK